MKSKKSDVIISRRMHCFKISNDHSNGRIIIAETDIDVEIFAFSRILMKNFFLLNTLFF